MSENAFFAALFFPSAAAVLIFSMKYVAAIMQARARVAQDEAYRDLAAKTASAQAETATALTALGATLNQMQTRLTVLEKILREVE
jgi:Tfp pilus assembly protein PilO